MNARPFSQAVSWPGTSLGADAPEDFVQFIADEFKSTRAQYIGCFITKPDMDQFGGPIPDTGGRSDLVFCVHEDDIGKFAVARLNYGMRWVDDVIANEKMRDDVTIYQLEFHALCSWETDGGKTEDEHREDGSETGCVGE